MCSIYAYMCDIHMCAMTRVYVWIDKRICVTYICVLCTRICVTYIYVPWRAYIRDLTYAYMCHRIRVTYMTSHVWLDACLESHFYSIHFSRIHQLFWHPTHSCKDFLTPYTLWGDIFDMTHAMTSYVWHDVCHNPHIYVPWLIYMCRWMPKAARIEGTAYSHVWRFHKCTMTSSYVRHDPILYAALLTSMYVRCVYLTCVPWLPTYRSERHPAVSKSTRTEALQPLTYDSFDS